MGNERAWERNETYLGVMAWLWSHGRDRKLVIVNYSMLRSQAFVRISEVSLDMPFLQLRDGLTDLIYNCPGKEIFEKGFYVDLLPWQAQLLDFVI